MEETSKKALEALRKEIAAYSKLKQLKQTEGFEDYLTFLANAAATQMMQPYWGGKILTHEEFAGVWGEVRGKLYILQELGGAELIEQQLVEQLRQFQNPQGWTGLTRLH